MRGSVCCCMMAQLLGVKCVVYFGTKYINILSRISLIGDGKSQAACVTGLCDIELSKLSTVTDGAVSSKTIVKDTTFKMSWDGPVSIHTARARAMWDDPLASLITHYINFTPCMLTLFPETETQHNSLSSSRSKGQTAAQLASCQIYNMEEALRHILTFSHDSVASPERCNLCHPHWPWGALSHTVSKKLSNSDAAHSSHLHLGLFSLIGNAAKCTTL